MRSSAEDVNHWIGEASSGHRRGFLRRLRITAGVGLLCVTVGLALPWQPVIPVEGASPADWNHQTFWHYPWGRSVVHKGIDVFAPEGRAVVAATPGIVVFAGNLRRGGRVVAILGPQWRVHYYAHLSSINVEELDLVHRGEAIGRVGRTGNAAATPSHLHYSILTLLPYPWRADSKPHGWRKMFYLDPTEELLSD